ncbi:differentially expressed in FDCP 8 homolog [Homalodisca vitripennis]|uniref:differentially expressed in FDCP 8 homolog n=2 Tax=Homalodisca vitripennis TaxID=197043 RepID=UPI001EEAC7CC|nr:differentially expressed in FDCP 8 homolog [Homalodisca vitripennis]XP_046665079.1 differentially expressed in FDCP 8 homolog [Homalodisca vitripennis]
MEKKIENCNLPLPSTSSSPTSEKIASTDHGDESSEENLPMPKSLIGAENYLTLTEGKVCALTKEELTEAITKCKILILDSAVCSDERKWLVRRLIELRYQLLTVEDLQVEKTDIDESSLDISICLGHHLIKRFQPTSTTKRYCDVCCTPIWNVVQYWYQCKDCRYKCHIKCVENTIRPCAHLVQADKERYERKICPEVGLAAQNYECGECKLRICFNKNSWSAPPRLCDYTGLYYCTSCHWNNTAVIPARVSRNWDFKSYLVCRASYQLLRYTRNWPIVTVEPRLYGFVKELAEIKRLREQLSLMKHYIIPCRMAEGERKLMEKQFKGWSYFLEHDKAFSLHDLMEIHSGKLLDELKNIASKFEDHIIKNCQLCSGKGYRCELCDDKDDVIFPFFSTVNVCSECSWVYHKTCWLRYLVCRKCQRNKKKQLETVPPES